MAIPPTIPTIVTKMSKVMPVECLLPEAQAKAASNLTMLDFEYAAANVSTFIDGYANQIVNFQSTVPPVNGLAILGTTVGPPVTTPPGTTPADSPDRVSAPAIRNMIETLITEYSRVRTIRFVRMGDGLMTERYARINSPDSSTSEIPVTDFGTVFQTNNIDHTEYLRVVAAAAVVMRANFEKLFAVIPYCHVSCHVDIPPPPPTPPFGGGDSGAGDGDTGQFEGDVADDPGGEDGPGGGGADNGGDADAGY